MGCRTGIVLEEPGYTALIARQNHAFARIVEPAVDGGIHIALEFRLPGIDGGVERFGVAYDVPAAMNDDMDPASVIPSSRI